MTLTYEKQSRQKLTQTVYKSILRFVLPARCLMCRETIEDPLRPHVTDRPFAQPSVCASCWGRLTFLSDACCYRCGIPFDVSAPSQTDLICGACFKEPPPFDQTKSALLYDAESKDLILRFKHGDATHMAPTFSVWLHHAGSAILTQTDYLVPVPLHWKRLLKRHYNQAALLSNALTHQSGVPSLLEGLQRVANTPTQGSLSHRERHQNVSGKFVVPAKKTSLVNKKVITLLDDVYTSGATVKACALALKQAGASRVNILTLARVARL